MGYSPTTRAVELLILRVQRESFAVVMMELPDGEFEAGCLYSDNPRMLKAPTGSGSYALVEKKCRGATAHEARSQFQQWAASHFSSEVMLRALRSTDDLKTEHKLLIGRASLSPDVAKRLNP